LIADGEKQGKKFIQTRLQQMGIHWLWAKNMSFYFKVIRANHCISYHFNSCPCTHPN
jgi:hypothetical protein